MRDVEGDCDVLMSNGKISSNTDNPYLRLHEYNVIDFVSDQDYDHYLMS